MSSSILRLLRHRLFSTSVSVSPSAILTPSNPSAVLSASEKSLAALRLLKQLPRDPPSSGGGAVDPSSVISICSAASLTPTVHVDRIALSIAVNLLSPVPTYVRSLISSVLLPPSTPDPHVSRACHVSHAIILYGQARLLNDALSLFKSNPSTKALNSLLLAAIIAGDHDAASRFFTDLPGTHNVVPDVNTYNTMIKSFSESGSTRSAYSLLEEMRKQNVSPNDTTFIHILAGFYKEQSFDEVQKVLGLMKSYDCNPQSLLVYNARIEGLCKLSKSAEAEDLYKEMTAKKIKPNWKTMHGLILGFCKEGNLKEAKRLYNESEKKKIVHASSLYFNFLPYLCQGGDFETGLRVCKDAMKRKWVPNFKNMKVLVEGLAKKGKVEEAEELAGQMKEKFPDNAEAWQEVEDGISQ